MKSQIIALCIVVSILLLGTIVFIFSKNYTIVKIVDSDDITDSLKGKNNNRIVTFITKYAIKTSIDDRVEQVFKTWKTENTWHLKYEGDKLMSITNENPVVRKEDEQNIDSVVFVKVSKSKYGEYKLYKCFDTKRDVGWEVAVTTDDKCNMQIEFTDSVMAYMFFREKYTRDKNDNLKY